VEVVALELAYLVLVVHRDQPGQRVTQALRATLVNAALPDQKALVVFRVLLDLLEAELEEPLFPVPKDLGVPLVLPDPRASKASKVLLDPLVLPEQMGNQDSRAIMARLVLLDRRVLPDLLESVVPPVRMQSPLSLTSISPRTRQPRPTARRLMSKMLSDRPTRSRTALGTTLR